MENKTMMTDFYELTMAQTYFDQGKKDEMAYFDIFFRTNPFKGGYTMTGGLSDTIKYLQNFVLLKFRKKEVFLLNHLCRHGFHKRSNLEFLRLLQQKL